LFSEAVRMFSPFSHRSESPTEIKAAPAPQVEARQDPARDIEGLREQMAEMQAKLEALSRK
jgi:polyhydroxyalkanoate synthesis regulator protein